MDCLKVHRQDVMRMHEDVRGMIQGKLQGMLDGFVTETKCFRVETLQNKR